MKISVVIPCRNGEKVLGRQLAALAAQVRPGDFEVIVADNGSTDRTLEAVNRYRDQLEVLRVVDAGRAPGINVARNEGILAARGDFFLLCDADDRVHPGWIAAARAAAESGADLIAGSQRLVWPDGTEIENVVGPRHTLGYLPWTSGANLGFSRAAWERVGSFDESFAGGGDDIDYCWRVGRAGYEMVSVPDMAIDYVQRATERAVLSQVTSYAESHPLLFKKFRPYGMPRSRTLLAPIRLALGMVQYATSRRRSPRRFRAVTHLAIACGRLRGSVRHRTLYL